MLAAALVPVVVAAVLAYLSRQQKLAARKSATGDSILDYGAAWKVTGLVISAAWAALFAFLVVESPPKEDDMPALWLLVALSTGLLLPYLLTVYRVAYYISPSGFRKRSPWSRDFSSDWAGVKKVSYNQNMGQFIVTTDSGNARISRFLNGLGEFRDALVKHVPEQSWAGARKELESLK